jgi:ubiquinone/menaquinone biosynthesis C-methylase UbiE
MIRSHAQLAAELYDLQVPDWPGEIAFYRALAAEAAVAGAAAGCGAVLEVACGTGRVAVRLAQDGVRLVGLDVSPEMLEVARAKSAGLVNVRWVLGDMRSFELGATLALVIVPGHSFQHMLTEEDQFACLACIRRHLAPGGRLVLHLDAPDVAWLGGLCTGQGAAAGGGAFGPASEVVDPATGHRVRTSRAWSYEPSTQTASVVSDWEEIGPDGQLLDRWQRGPVRLHSVFRFEVAHLLARTGFEVEALYGDFRGGEFGDASSDMIWVARLR